MIDPISLTGLAMIGSKVLSQNSCPICKQVRLFSKWTQWTCCQVAQCSECAASTEQTKTCQCCGTRVR